MNFIESFEEIVNDYRFILMIVCYFNRFIISFVCRINNVENVIWCLTLFFAMYRKFHAFYLNSNQHFDNEILREYFKNENIVVDYNSFDFSKFTDMMKLFNKLFEKILRKNHFDVDWVRRISIDVKFVNDRIINYLDVNSIDINFEVVFEIFVITFTLLNLFERDIEIWYNELATFDSHVDHVRNYLQYRVELHDIVREITRRRRENEAFRYNKNVRQIIHQIDNLIMLYQKTIDKLQFRWRDSFQIIDYENNHERFFTLRQLTTRRNIRDTFHEDHLKIFVFRIDHLVSDIHDSFESNRTIRQSRRIRVARNIVTT